MMFQSARLNQIVVLAVALLSFFLAHKREGWARLLNLLAGLLNLFALLAIWLTKKTQSRSDADKSTLWKEAGEYAQYASFGLIMLALFISLSDKHS